ncbi:MAG: efflux RND transporter periplasmic adaptor subunit [Paludibacteraceae bacterium]|nr:efflux RND transporter periplasmic adaptor subunit [Paludibacteraceae bacterium]
MQHKLLLILSAAMFCACSPRQANQAERQPIDVRVMQVADRSDSHARSYAGRLEAKTVTPLGLQTAGRVVEIKVQPGERVQAGQMLLRVDNTQAMNALEAARVTMRQAQDAYDRVRPVHDSGVVSDLKWVEVETRLNQARTAVETAEQLVRQCTLTAPASGVIGSLKVEQGQSVLPSETLMELMDVSEYYVRFGVPESEIATVHIGDKGMLHIAAIGGDDIPVTVCERGMKANVVAHTYEVRARLSRTEAVLPGMIGDVSLGMQQVEGLIVPTECIRLMKDRPTVWVARDSVAVRCDVRTGEYTNSGVVIDSGLQPGDRVIIEGFQKLYNNAPIHY